MWIRPSSSLTGVFGFQDELIAVVVTREQRLRGFISNNRLSSPSSLMHALQQCCGTADRYASLGVFFMIHLDKNHRRD